MSKKKAKEKAAELEEDIELTEEEIAAYRKEDILPTTTGLFLLLVAWAAGIAITRYILHATTLTITSSYMLYETAITVVIDVILLVGMNYVRVQGALEKAESPEDFPQGGPFGFLAGKPLALVSELIAIFLVLFCGINCLVFKIVGIAEWGNGAFIIYKAVYSLIMVILIHWMSFGRFLQFDVIEKGLKEKKAKKN